MSKFYIDHTLFKCIRGVVLAQVDHQILVNVHYRVLIKAWYSTIDHL
jgi:hypothetical protein